jgi:hypothetical protein
MRVIVDNVSASYLFVGTPEPDVMRLGQRQINQPAGKRAAR